MATLAQTSPRDFAVLLPFGVRRLTIGFLKLSSSLFVASRRHDDFTNHLDPRSSHRSGRCSGRRPLRCVGTRVSVWVLDGCRSFRRDICDVVRTQWRIMPVRIAVLAAVTRDQAVGSLQDASAEDNRVCSARQIGWCGISALLVDDAGEGMLP